MENPIVLCPGCKKPIVDQKIIEDAVKGEGITTRSIVCACGEKITFWQITAQLRDQKTFGWKLRNWIKSLSHSH